MDSPLSPAPSPIRPDIHEEVYELLLDYLPATLQKQVGILMTTARDLFEKERHFEVLQTLDRVTALCDAAMVGAAGDESAVHATVPDVKPASVPIASSGGAAERSPTGLSLRIFRKFIEASHMYVTSTLRARDCNELLRDIGDESGWRQVSVDDKGQGTFYRLDKPTGHHYFKIVSDTTVNPIYLCCTIMELDLYPEWFPLCTSAQSQGDVSRFHKSSHFIMGVPWPFADRDAFIEGYGIDDLEQNNRIIIVAHSLYEDRGPLPEGICAPQPHSNTVRCDVFYGGFLIQIVSVTTTRVSFIMSVDPKVPRLPQSALNWVSRRVLGQMMVDIQKASARGIDPSSKYWKRRRERHDVYELFRERYNDVVRKKAPPEEHERLLLKPDY